MDQEGLERFQSMAPAPETDQEATRPVSGRYNASMDLGIATRMV